MSSPLGSAVRAPRGRLLAALAAAAASLFVAVPGAGAAVPSVNIGAPGGPLTTVAIGNDLSCQVKHTGDDRFSFYPSSVSPGDCGTFVAAGGTVFGPNFAQHDSTATGDVTGSNYQPFATGNQSQRTGSGRSGSPFKVTTTATAGSLAVTEVDSYIAGQEAYRTDISVTNNGGSPVTLTLYRAGDCFLQESDTGFGFTGPNGAVGCSKNPNNTPAGRIMEWVPITGGANFLEDTYSNVWEAISKQTAFPNQCVRCTDNVDNGAGISWTVTLNPGQTQTLSHFTTFSPTGRVGPPPAVVTPTVNLTGVPVACTTRNFTARVTAKNSSRVQVFLDGRRAISTKRSNFTFLVRVNNVIRGRHVLRVTATSSSGRKATRTRAFSRCALRRVAPRFTG